MAPGFDTCGVAHARHEMSHVHAKHVAMIPRPAIQRAREKKEGPKRGKETKQERERRKEGVDTESTCRGGSAPLTAFGRRV